MIEIAAEFAKGERERAVAWKLTSATLPDAARRPARYVHKGGSGSGPAYDFCLPSEYAEYSLLPEVRDAALALFAELGIPWHAGVGSGPGNHLLSSQVQCANALGQMVRDPGRVVLAFGQVLGTVEVEQIEPGRWLTFEYIGPEDFLHEAVGGVRVRGAGCGAMVACKRSGPPSPGLAGEHTAFAADWQLQRVGTCVRRSLRRAGHRVQDIRRMRRFP